MATDYETRQYSSGTYTGIQIVDIDQDGKPEVLAGHRDNTSIEIWRYDPSTQSLEVKGGVSFSYDVHDFQVADFDKDGDLDIAAGIRFNGLEYARNDGNGNWSVSSIDGTYSWRVQVADFDQDGNLDILDGVDGAQGLKIFYGDGAGSFVEGTAPVWGQRGVVVNAVDLDRDGRTDIIGLKEGAEAGETNELKAFLNLGSREWTDSVGPSAPISDYPLRVLAEGNVSAGDLDGNGYIDQVAVQWDQTASDPEVETSQLIISKGGSSGGNLTWTPQLVDTMPGRQTTAGLADFNNDGHADVYASWTTGPNLYACLGDGEGSFTKEVINLSGAGPDLHALAVGDLNGDARADIVTGSGGLNEPNGFQVLLELAPAEPIVGTSKDDVLTGTARGEAIEGLAGDDVLQGLAGADSISAGEGCDLVSAGERNPSQGRR